MARKRKTAPKKNTAPASTDQVEVTDDALTSDADLAAIEALLDGDGEVTLDSPKADEPAPEAVDAKDESADDHDLVDEALAAIEAEAEVEAAPVVVSDDEIADDVASEIEGVDAKAEAYADQESDVDIVTDEAKAEKKASKPRAPKLSFEESIRLIHANEPLTLDMEVGPLDDEGISTLIASVPQVKVKEKVVNLLDGVISGKTMSNYTVIALELLKAAYHSGEPLTSAQIRKAYEEKGYKSGTVNAQQGQMMVLFDALGMAKRLDKATLQPNPNSVLLDALCA